MTQYLGFLKFGDEYKVMGLGAYGEPEFLEEFRDIVHSNGAGFRLGLRILHASPNRAGNDLGGRGQNSGAGKDVFRTQWQRSWGRCVMPAAPIEQRHKNLACSLQARLEEVYLGMLRHLARETGMKSVCLAGGVAFNCVANGKIPANTGFENVYVHPAAGDAGLAVGAAQYRVAPEAGESARICDGACVLGAGIFA